MKDLKSIFKKIFITPEKECCCKVKITREQNDKKESSCGLSENQKTKAE
ncbi:hypothetical protein [Turicimonas muris]